MACNVCAEVGSAAAGNGFQWVGEKGCHGFQPHQWLPNKCVNCRHDKGKHTVILSDSPRGNDAGGLSSLKSTRHNSSSNSNRSLNDKVVPPSAKFRAYFSDGDEAEDLSDPDLGGEDDEEDGDATPTSSPRDSKSSNNSKHKKGESTGGGGSIFKKPPPKKGGSSRANSHSFLPPPLPRKSSSSSSGAMNTSTSKLKTNATTTPPIPSRERSASVAVASDPGAMARLKEAFGWGTKAKKAKATASTSLSSREASMTVPKSTPSPNSADSAAKGRPNDWQTAKPDPRKLRRKSDEEEKDDKKKEKEKEKEKKEKEDKEKEKEKEKERIKEKEKKEREDKEKEKKKKKDEATAHKAKAEELKKSRTATALTLPHKQVPTVPLPRRPQPPPSLESPEVIRLREENAKLLQEISEITVTNQQLFNALREKTTENVRALTEKLNDLEKKYNESTEENAALKKILEAYKHHNSPEHDHGGHSRTNSGNNISLLSTSNSGRDLSKIINTHPDEKSQLSHSSSHDALLSNDPSKSQSQQHPTTTGLRKRPPSRSAPSPPVTGELQSDKSHSRQSIDISEDDSHNNNSNNTTTTTTTTTTVTSTTTEHHPPPPPAEATLPPQASSPPPARPPPPLPALNKSSGLPVSPRGGELKLSSMVKRARANMEKSKYRKSQSLNGNEIRLLHEQEKRNNVVKEILTTERNYVKALGIVREKYQKVLEAKIGEEERKAGKSKQGVTMEHLKAIFLHIAVIHGYNTLLCRRLEERIDTTDWGSESVLGDIFVDMGPHLRLYSNYIGNYSTALEVLKMCKADKKFADMLSEIESAFLGDRKNPFYGYQLETFLITPVQRIPRYITLLKQLQKYTPEGHADCKLLEEAIQKIEEVATENEKVQERNENISILFNIERRFGQTLKMLHIVEPHRLFLHQGRVILYRYTKDNLLKDAKARKRYHLLLFNDILIIAKPKRVESFTEPEEEEKEEKEKEKEGAGDSKEKEKEKEKEEKAKKKRNENETNGRLRYVRHLDVRDCEVSESEAIAAAAGKFTFRLQHPDYSYCVSLADVTQKEKWMSELRQAISEIRTTIRDEKHTDGIA